MAGLPRQWLKEEYVSPEWKKWTKASTEWRDGNAVPNQPVDIIAVQGLASTYERTWTKECADGTGVMWLRDLLPHDLPLARILTFEYDSRWLKDPSFVSLKDCADRLLQAIMWDRTHRGSDAICKKMAVVHAASQKPHERYYNDYISIAASVSGIIYLGTPHNGSSYAKPAMFKARIRSTTGRPTNDKLLKTLVIDSAIISRLREDFERFRGVPELIGLRMFFFWETKPLAIGRVVEEDSACFGAAPGCSAGLEANHMEMNKFGHREESNYRKVMDALRQIFNHTEEVIGSRWGKNQYDSRYASDDLKSVKTELSPLDPTSRYLSLKGDQSEGTCTWVRKLDIVARWLSPKIPSPIPKSLNEGRCLWIHGKPGSGKSVLTAYLYSHLENLVRSHDKSIADPPCSGVGESEPCELETASGSWAALYFPFQGHADIVTVINTLIHQLLRRCSENRVLHDLVRGHEPKSATEGSKLLGKLLGHFSFAYIIIDGVDECSAPTRLLEKLRGLCEMPRVRVLVVSRQDKPIELEITKHFCSPKAGINVFLNNGPDINHFISKEVSRLAAKAPVVARLQDHIRGTIEQRSRGMFQWVKLVVDALEYKNSDEGEVLYALEHFPLGLDDAYRKAFRRLERAPGYDREQTCWALKWLACATRPLTLHELYVAIIIQAEWERSATAESFEELSEGELEEKFAKLLGPLAEVQQPQSEAAMAGPESTTRRSWKTIQICHHSLTQLLHIPGVLESSNNTPFFFLDSDAHALAAATCMRMMCAQTALQTYLGNFYTPQCLLDETPFLGYAFENWSQHLRASQIANDKGEHDPIGLAEQILTQSLELSLVIMGTLAGALERIDPGRLKQMMQTIAVRDSQAAISPAINAVVKVIPVLPDLTRMLRDVNRRLGKEKKNAVQRLSKNSLNHNLDSTLVCEVFSLLKSNPSLLKPLEPHLSLLRTASRTLRTLTVRLSIDPMRTWLYTRTGPDGLSPIPALAQATHLLDVFMAHPLLPPTRDDKSDFRDQFIVNTDHHLYGPVTSTRNELSEKCNKSLTAVEYKAHIIDHYLLSAWEWKAVEFATRFLEVVASPSNQFFINYGIQLWQVCIVKRPQYENEAPGASPSVGFNTMRPSSRKEERVTWADAVWCVPGFLAMFLLKLVLCVCPDMEWWFLCLGYQVVVKLMFRKGCNKLFQEWRYTSIALVFYLMRLRYSPFLFYRLRNNPWTDLKGIISHPFEYKEPFSEIARNPTLVALIFVQHVLPLWYMGREADYEERLSDGVPEYLMEPIRRRVSSFNFSRTGRTLYEQIRDNAIRLVPRGDEVFIRFLNLLFIEELIFDALYIIIDLLKIAVHLLQPSSWTWHVLARAVGTLAGQLIVKKLGIFSCIGLWVVWKVWRWLQFDLYFWRAVALAAPAAKWIWFITPLSYVFIKIENCFIALGQAPVRSQLTSVLVVASTFVLLTAVFTFIMMDPLRLKKAAKSCSAARQAAAQIISVEDPLETLGWQAGDGSEPANFLSFVDLNQMETFNF